MAADNTKKKYGIDVIGLYGLETEFKLCHLPFIVENDVMGCLALEGSSGTGKTTIVKRLGELNARVTGGAVGTYSADKAKYEDFIGCPIPDPETKLMTMYAMPNAVATNETILVDEINRATYENQEKWLSLFASREIDGLKVKCKYLFAAMNPILSEENDVYEGVQPLDKALGERVFALVRMPQFAKMNADDRLYIMKTCFDQVNWSPSDESVERFRNFITAARVNYEQNKDTYAGAVATYVDNIQQELYKETKGHIAIEARRAQFILTNILAVHAIDNVTKNTSMEQSALNALLISFPNPLWEQPINYEALRQAHMNAKSMLKINKSGIVSFANSTELDRALEPLVKLTNSKDLNREIASKVIFQSLPNVKTDPINHYIYAYNVVAQLGKGEKKNQPAMKQEEYSKMYKLYEEVNNSPYKKHLDEVAKDYDAAGEQIPKNYKFPEYVSMSDEEGAKNVYFASVAMPPARAVMSILKLTNTELEVMPDLLVVMRKMLKAQRVFRDLRAAFEDNSTN